MIGQSGAGKTALMSKLASEMIQIKNEAEGKEKRIPVIVRFCGSSRLSLHGKDLIENISLQILSLYERREEMTELLGKLASQNYEVAVASFHEVLKKYPLVLIIDNLDQLSDRD